MRARGPGAQTANIKNLEQKNDDKKANREGR
jgi:hypothetical protein